MTAFGYPLAAPIEEYVVTTAAVIGYATQVRVHG